MFLSHPPTVYYSSCSAATCAGHASYANTPHTGPKNVVNVKNTLFNNSNIIIIYMVSIFPRDDPLLPATMPRATVPPYNVALKLHRIYDFISILHPWNPQTTGDNFSSRVFNFKRERHFVYGITSLQENRHRPLLEEYEMWLSIAREIQFNPSDLMPRQLRRVG